MNLRLLPAAGLACLMLAACQAPVRAPAPDTAPAGHTPQHAPAARPEPVADAGRDEPEPAALIEPAPLPDTVRGGDVFARLVANLADPPCVTDRVVQRWEQTYGRWAPRFRQRMEEILPLLAMVVEELESHALPAEFALLPIVESWYHPTAGTAGGTYGMWQFSRGTARLSGLKIDDGYDGRAAPQASTRAAMRHLALLMNRFGDWKLAGMAFNAGEYRLQRALARSGATPVPVSAEKHLPPGLSTVTYEHLAKSQALACLIAHPERFGLELPLDLEVPALQAVAIPAGLETIDAVAQRAGLDAQQARALNPAYRGGRIHPSAPREVLLPRAATHRLLRAPAVPELASGTAQQSETPVAAPPRGYVVQRGDTLGAIAKRHGLTLRQLLEWNRLDARALIRPGQRLRLEP